MKDFLIFALKPVCYNSYLYFANALADALKACGHTVEIFPACLPIERQTEMHTLSDSPDSALFDSLEELIGRSFDAMIDFNSELPRLKMEDGSYFLDQINAPFYNIILDHPLYHHDTLKQRITRFHILCLDENHKDYIEGCYPHISTAHVFPMTGEDIAPSDPSYPKKHLDILFSGTYTDFRQIEDSIETCPSFLGTLTRQLISVMQSDPALTQEAALGQLLPSLEEAEIIEETFPLHMQACFLCDSYLRAWKREQLLLHLAKDNLPLTLCGNGWNKSPLAGFPQIRIIEDTPFMDTFSLFRQSKITLNLMPEFKRGAHDRIYSAMLNHSLCLTDASSYLTRQFQNRRELLFYDTQNLENLSNCIQNLLSSPELTEEISQTGYFCAKENHSWLARAVSLADIVTAQIAR